MSLVILLQSLGLSAVTDDHHSAGNDLHHVAHELGHAHSHDSEDKQSFTIEFSREAIDHVTNALDSVSTDYVTVTINQCATNHLCSTEAQSTYQHSDPYLSYSGPPPKV